MKIAYVMQNTGVDLTSDAGAASLVKSTLNCLLDEGHSMGVLALDGLSVKLMEDAARLEKKTDAPLGLAGNKALLLVERAIRRLQGMLRVPYVAWFDSWRFYQACLRVLPNYQVCHEYHGLFCLGAALACKRLNIPYVITADADLLFELEVVGRPLRGLHARLAEWEVRWGYRMAQKILCVSEAARRRLVEHWGVPAEKCVVLPNAVDAGRFAGEFDRPRIRAEWQLGNAPVVGFVGSFQPWHGLELLLESFAETLTHVPQAKLLLVGDGPIRADIEAQVAAMGLTDSVVMAGFVPQSAVPELVSVMDVAVIPYPKFPQELWFSPLKLYEYMAAGKAIVASADGQIAAVLKHQHTGRLIEPGHVPGLTTAIVTLLKDPAERARLGAAAQAQAITRHSWENYARQLTEVYQSVLGTSS